ncbi:TerD family protein [Streptomyces sp. NPDC050549]|uniref:TerD family protein n=1 Tax=Streptomyces sp. NPDC050549 TaxID=3155406 RepID=UPI003427BED7
MDASALLLDAVGNVRGDTDLVFCNQPAHPSGAVRHAGTGKGEGQFAEWLEVELQRVEPEVQRVLIAGSCDGGDFGQVPGLVVRAMTSDGAVVAHYDVTDASSETAFVLGEFYRRDGAWKFRAVGQGYASGLAGPATDFGIAVAEPAPAPTPAATAAFPFGADFPAHVQEGRGNGVVSVAVPLPPGPVIVEAWHDGEGYFSIHTLDKRNKDDDFVCSSTLYDFRGRALVHPPQDRPLRLSLKAENTWKVLVQPLPVARVLGPGPLQGYGPEVVAHTGTAADLDAEFAGDENGQGYFSLSYLEADQLNDRSEIRLLISATGPLRQTAPVPDGPLLLLLKADGPWQLTARPLTASTEPVAKVSTPTPTPTPTPAPAPVAQAQMPIADPPVTKDSTGSPLHKGRGEQTITLVNPRPGRRFPGRPGRAARTRPVLGQVDPAPAARGGRAAVHGHGRGQGHHGAALPGPADADDRTADLTRRRETRREGPEPPLRQVGRRRRHAVAQAPRPGPGLGGSRRFLLPRRPRRRGHEVAPGAGPAGRGTGAGRADPRRPVRSRTSHRARGGDGARRHQQHVRLRTGRKSLPGPQDEHNFLSEPDIEVDPSRQVDGRVGDRTPRLTVCPSSTWAKDWTYPPGWDA